MLCRCGCSCCASTAPSDQSSDGASDAASTCNAVDPAAGTALAKAGAGTLCPIDGAVLRLADSTVTLECADAVALFDRAEEIADGKVNRFSFIAPLVQHIPVHSFPVNQGGCVLPGHILRDTYSSCPP